MCHTIALPMPSIVSLPFRQRRRPRLCKWCGSYLGNSQQRRAFNQDTVTRALAADTGALASLNGSQRNAVRRSLAQRVLLIQGPPGTGKTQVAHAIFRSWQSIKEVGGPAVGAAPSNVAADNLARRLLQTTTLSWRPRGRSSRNVPRCHRVPRRRGLGRSGRLARSLGASARVVM